MFAKFHTKQDRDVALKLVQESCLKSGYDKIWAKPDRSIPERAIISIIFGLKRILTTEWKYAKKAVWADDVSGDVWVGDERAIRVHVEEGKLNIDYGSGWKEWLTQENYPEFKQLTEFWVEKINQAESSGKGREKGSEKGAVKGQGKVGRKGGWR